MDHNKITLNGFEYTFTDNNEWIYKAVPFKKDARVGPEKPQIKLVEKLEENYKKAFDKMLVDIVKDIGKYLAV